MARRNLFLGFAAGLLAGAVSTIALSTGHAVPRAMAQAVPPPALGPFEAPPIAETGPAPNQLQPVPPRPPAAAQRYQVAAWAYPAAWSPPNGGVGDRASHGCYILDTESGQMWSIEGESRKPTRLGKVGSDQ